MKPTLIPGLLRPYLDPDVRSWVRRLVASPLVDAVDIRVIRPRPSLELRREMGPGLDAVHNDDDTQPVRALWEHAQLPVCDDGDVVVVTSRVTMRRGRNGRLRWLLLLDFRCPVSPEHQAELARHLRALGWVGVLVETGSSYHFLGAEALDVRAWFQRMHQALLIPGIDWRYCGHALLRQAGSARITTCELKPFQPRVVEIIKPREDAQ